MLQRLLGTIRRTAAVDFLVVTVKRGVVMKTIVPVYFGGICAMGKLLGYHLQLEKQNILLGGHMDMLCEALLQVGRGDE